MNTDNIITAEDLTTARHNARASIANLINRKHQGVLTDTEEDNFDRRIAGYQEQFDACAVVLRLFGFE